MARGLSDFLDEAMRRPFVWGHFDCVLFLADWSTDQLGKDPAAAYRGRYRSALGAERIIRRAGGLVSLIAREFEPLGWAKAHGWEPGDIAVVDAHTRQGSAPAGAIFTGAHWACITEQGLALASFQTRQVWRA